MCRAVAARLHSVEGVAGATGLGELGGSVPGVGVRALGVEPCTSKSQTAVLVSAVQSIVSQLLEGVNGERSKWTHKFNRQ
jgi:hypothetical protein